MINIRRFEEKDKKKVHSLIKKVLTEVFGAVPKRGEVEAGFFDYGGVLYVAEDSGNVVGTMGLIRQSPRIGRIKRVYVDKAYRGGGISNKLWFKILEFSKAVGYKRLILSAAPEMKRAISFFRKHGFVRAKDSTETQVMLYKNI